MTGHLKIIQSRGYKRTGTFAGPRVRRGDDSRCGLMRPSPVRLPHAHGPPAHVRAGCLFLLLVQLLLEVGEHLEELALERS